MEFLTDLWMPIVLSAVFVFVASSVIHMVLQSHNKDFGAMPGEADVMTSMRGAGLKQGMYMFPHAGSFKECSTPEHMEKLNQGPVGFMYVLPNGPPNLGKCLALWFVYSLIVSVFVAYLGNLALQPGADAMAVFRITGTVAFLGYGLGSLLESIWKGQDWGVTARFLFDGLIYALVTGGTFGWLWPSLGDAIGF